MAYNSLSPVILSIRTKLLLTGLTHSCTFLIGKAAGADKKLYKQIENKYDPSSLMSPPDDDSIRSIISPFGPMNQPASRRTLFYLIGTLNASFPDYDFSYVYFRVCKNELFVTRLALISFCKKSNNGTSAWDRRG
jgi:hypothetical protein